MTIELSEENIAKDKESSLKEEIAKDLHALFLESMETRYKEILSFLGFLLPALTGFLWLINNYDPTKTGDNFLFGSLAIIFILFWGSFYVLAVSYRYRYLQACVYLIEELTGADVYIPKTFKPKPIEKLGERIFLSIAPGILQIHLYFFILFVCTFCVTFHFLVDDWTKSIILISFSILILLLIIYAGGWHYPKKLENILDDLEKRRSKINQKGINMLIFITGPSEIGKSTMRNYYCKKSGIQTLSAVTTRPQRTGESEIHKTITDEKFMSLLDNKELCLVKNNYGYYYGYLCGEIRKKNNLLIIEVDSKTAIKYYKDFDAKIIRIIPSNRSIAIKKIKFKRDNIENRLKDFNEQMDENFLKTRKNSGDIFFVNNYDRESLDRFCNLIDSLVIQTKEDKYYGELN